MSSELVLFEAVAAGAIETVLDNQNQPWFKRADLERYLGIVDIRHMFKGIKTTSRLEIMGGVQNPSLGKRKNPHDAFVNLDSALEIAVRSRKPKAVVLVKWLAKKGVEKLQEDHQKAIEERDRRIQAIEYENVELQGQITAYQAQLQVSQNIALWLSTLCRIAELVESMWITVEIPVKTT